MRYKLSKAASTFTIVVFAGPLSAQVFEGLYQPTGYNWSCSAEYLGADGGAVGIVDGYLEGVENRCKLTSPRPNRTGDSITYTAVCSAEGTEYREEVTLSQTDAGVDVTRGGYTVSWTKCGSTAQAQPSAPEGRWGFSDRYAYIVAGENQFSLSCELFNPSSTYPTATMSVPCPACFPKEVTTYTLRVDGQFAQEYEFERISNADGSQSDLDYYPDWHDGLVAALMAGSVLEVLEQGNVIAAFPLSGSSRAIGQLRQRCN